MAAEDLNLTGVKTLDQALARTKNGVAAIELAKRMGLWTDSLHTAPGERRAFPVNLSELSMAQLSDLYAYWTSEHGRLMELCGAVAGQQEFLKVQLKSTQASTRARLRRAHPTDAKPVAQAVLADLCEEDAAVIDLVDQTALLAMLAAHAQAAREATQQYLSTISRQIAFLDAQLKARIY